MPIPTMELNHAVLYVRSVSRAVAFYRDVLGLEVLVEDPHGRAAFLRARGSSNHHELGLISVGPNAPAAPKGSPGLYHLAWRVPTIEDLAAAKELLVEHGSLQGQSDHGVSKSIYGVDPDGNEFEIMWAVPADQWGEYAEQAVVQPLDLEAELARFGG